MMKKFLPLMLIVAGSLLTSISSFGAPKTAPACSNDQLKNFKERYFKLQEALNYGKNVKYDKERDKLILLKNDKPVQPGKEIEEKLFKEYQNALKKVALVYNKSNTTKSPEENNKNLISFFKSLKETDPLKDANKMNFKEILDELQAASKSEKNSITDDDRYLLENLLIHAHDFKCRVGWLETNDKKLKVKDRARAEEIRQTPLNRMLLALKSYRPDSSIVIADQDKTIEEAVQTHLDALKNWINKNDKCYKYLKTHSEKIQPGIQACNYQKFLESLNDSNVTMFEQILHFINANQKHGNVTPKALTGINDLKLESFIDGTSSDKNIDCPIIGKSVFLKNLPYKDNKFDLSKLKCKKNGSSERTDCKDSIKLVSNLDGKGLEILPNGKSPATSFSVVDNPNCTDINFAKPVASPPLDCAADKNKCENTTPPEVADDTDKKKKECEEKDRENDTKTPMNKWVWDGSKKECEDRKPATKESEEDTAAEAKPDVVYPNKPVPGRFQPITIPTRQVYILPGMP